MDEYISREALLAEIAADYGNWIAYNDTDESYRQGVKDNYNDTIRLINDIPAADVQPVKQWYSVEENQPDSVGDDVLVVDSYGKYHIAYYLSGSENWMNQDTGELIKDVVKWRYLEGDSNE